MIGVSVVIAALWRDGYVCLCPPSPSLDRWPFTQNARKNVGWGLDLRKNVLCCWSPHDGRFDGDCSLGGGG
jgi:hypothetical protein